MEKLNFNKFNKINTEFMPKIYKKDDKFLVILEALNIWGEGNNISEAYSNYNNKITKSESKTIDNSENSELFKEIVWRKRRNILLIILFLIGFVYAQMAVIYSLAYKFYKVKSVVSIINIMNEKLNNISIQDKHLLKKSIDDISKNLNNIINN